MSNTATEKILAIIKSARQKAVIAEMDYDFHANGLQVKARKSIDLFGESAMSQVADLVNESKSICDKFYAAYQSLVEIVDAQCRPLLEEAPDYMAVREVRDLIKWLNEESEIENNLLYLKYTQELDRDSAYEMLTKKVAVEAEEAAEAKAAAEAEKLRLKEEAAAEKQRIKEAEAAEKQRLKEIEAAEKQRLKEEEAARKAEEREKAAKERKMKTAVKNVASSATGTIGRELGKTIGDSIGGSFGKKIGGNVGASLGRGLLSTLFK
jgi:flagellar biosynthesis GTPase FlhF